MPVTGIGLLGAGRDRGRTCERWPAYRRRGSSASSISIPAASRASAECGISRVFRSWAELLDCPDVEAVAVLLPHDLHARTAFARPFVEDERADNPATRIARQRTREKRLATMPQPNKSAQGAPTNAAAG